MKTSPISDEEQKALNQAIDNKYAVPTVTKIYTPEEIAAVASQVTPLHYIRKGLSGTTTYLDAEPSGRARIRRLESSGEI